MKLGGATHWVRSALSNWPGPPYASSTRRSEPECVAPPSFIRASAFLIESKAALIIFYFAVRLFGKPLYIFGAL